MKYLKTILLLIAISLFSFFPSVPVIATAQVVQPSIFADLKGDASQGIDQTGGGSTSIDSTVGAAVNIISWITGAAAIIMIILSGFRFVTSNGDSNRVGSARSALIYALVGLAIVALAQFFVHFALNTASG